MKIGLDVMGGDFAPEATMLGAIQARKELGSDADLALVGKESVIKEILTREKEDPDRYEIIPAEEVIEMAEHPAKAFARKPDSSISIGFGLLKNGSLDGFASAGNTGAMLVGIHYSIRTISGIIRPAIAAFIPNETDTPTLVLDVGLNPDSKPDVLYQYAIMGSVYAENVWNIRNPRVALLNIGAEESKGNLVVKSAYEMMMGSKNLNLVGNGYLNGCMLILVLM